MNHKFYFLLVTLLFILSACEEKTNSQKNHPESDTKTINIEEKVLSEEVTLEEKEESTLDMVFHALEKRITTALKQTKEAPKKEPIPVIEYSYTFKDLKEQENILDISNDIYNFKNIQQPIIIMNVMATWCPPCRGQIPHLSKLQQKFKENIFVMASLVHDDISTEALNKFIIAQKMLFYVSVTQEENLKFLNILTPKLALSEDFPMPLTIVFVKGKYFTHYEGMIPEEMIESDINQLLTKITN
ncbi:MAG: Putative lipoprotein thiredoxin [uncultured Sulfurovum sp.]|uniref:Lipoprotein thiredoxin n=1 Tax=uncultured Sulfurovum sp. TaxID=269237 RepID=A0A6S6RX55_9BACT|nr:MAG: Putative lipoprotein thiredoxin [uncultured Sulfurovum sp.]